MSSSTHASPSSPPVLMELYSFAAGAGFPASPLRVGHVLPADTILAASAPSLLVRQAPMFPC